MQTGSSPMSQSSQQVSRFAVLLVGFFVIVVATAMLWNRFSESVPQIQPSAERTPEAHSGGRLPTGTTETADDAPFQLTERQRRGQNLRQGPGSGPHLHVCLICE